MKNIKNKSWYSLTVSICIGVVLFVLLMKISSVLNIIGTFLGFFSTVFFGAVIAYIVNPLAMFLRRKVFGKLKNEKTKAALGNACAFVLLIFILVWIGVLVVPQLVDSIKIFARNFNGYMDKLQRTLTAIGVSNSTLDLTSFINNSNDLLNTVKVYASKNMNTIMATTADVGSGVAQAFIALLLSIYFLAEKDKLKAGGARFLKALCKDQYEKVEYIIKESDKILNCYIVYNLIDAMVVGIVNAIFMTILGMPYTGLVSVLVAVFNIIPTFGPAIGAVIGGFLLLLVEPWYAVAFLIFTAVLQTLDGYVIKPKLFGDSLGVSGLWILIGIVAGGKMFGVVGILLAIPMVAILDMIYHKYLLPFLEDKDEEEIENTGE
ncbi:AI-2E family transporter [Pseudobutyrivibrio xylanivorans]|uniref:Predicted PurR-regulated permease PerM n=1 Tax=Pseudobutyrivibrio xylanivorans TaxID=185007 RepID=A0A1G5RZP4_PSEXY|nr:AI-2E family transporter [Pseudobutyrivibrio xylanivorans]SCZ79584.1 Predicted PurR-regulated permease PerM [Pseudobutyrivibrio xylanivorans]